MTVDDIRQIMPASPGMTAWYDAGGEEPHGVPVAVLGLVVYETIVSTWTAIEPFELLGSTAYDSRTFTPCTEAPGYLGTTLSPACTDAIRDAMALARERSE